MPVLVTEPPYAPEGQETVILVHGLWMTGAELRFLGWRLERCGFTVEYLRYPSWSGSLTESALRLSVAVKRSAGERVYLLGHSLGGIVIARMLELAPPQKPCHIALLGSAIRGSFVAKALAAWRLGRFIIGPVALEGLVEKSPALPLGRDILVVAGTLPFGFGRFFGLPFPHDGTVAVAETEVPGAQLLTVRASHVGMLFSSGVARGLCAFFRTGKL